MAEVISDGIPILFADKGIPVSGVLLLLPATRERAMADAYKLYMQIEDPLAKHFVDPDQNPMNRKKFLACFEFMRGYNPGEGFPCYRYFISYFSGHGGCDDGGVYLWPGSTTSDDEKVYLWEVAGILSEEDTFFRRNKFRCVLFFELSVKDGSEAIGTYHLPTGYENLVIAVSGLQKDGECRTNVEVNGEKCSIGKWTIKLCDELTTTFKKDRLLTEALASVKKDFPSSQYTSPTETLFLNETLPNGNDKFLKESKTEFESVICTQKDVFRKKDREMHGIAIVLAVVGKSGPKGTDVDLEEVGKAFQNLGYGVWKVSNPTKRKIASIVHICTSSQPTHEYMTVTWCKAVIFYFAGHGGSSEGQGYVIPSNEDGEKDPRVYIDSQIVEPFQPSNAPHLSSRYRLFFFDCCLSDSVGNPPSTVPIHSNSTPSSLPPRGQCLVAYATSLHYKSSGKSKSGGVWTRKLLENIRKYDLPISVVLDMTYEDVIYETNLEGHKIDENSSSRNVQGPHYVSSVGLFYLRDPSRNSKKKRSLAISGTNAVIASEDDIIPNSKAFTEALSSLNHADDHMGYFYKRIWEKFKLKESLKLTTTSLKFLFDLLQREQRRLTWTGLIELLEVEPKIKGKIDREDVLVADQVKKYIERT